MHGWRSEETDESGELDCNQIPQSGHQTGIHIQINNIGSSQVMTYINHGALSLSGASNFGNPLFPIVQASFPILLETQRPDISPAPK